METTSAPYKRLCYRDLTLEQVLTYKRRVDNAVKERQEIIAPNVAVSNIWKKTIQAQILQQIAFESGAAKKGKEQVLDSDSHRKIKNRDAIIAAAEKVVVRKKYDEIKTRPTKELPPTPVKKKLTKDVETLYAEKCEQDDEVKMKLTKEFETLYAEKCEQKELDCPICFEPFTNPHIITTCLHVFCKSCIDESWERKSECPSCNTAFKAKNLKYSFRDNNRLEAIKNKIEEKLGIKPVPKPTPTSPKKRKTPSEGSISSPIKKTIKKIIQEEDIVLKDKNEYLDAISISGGIKATNCYQLRHLIAIKNISLRNVNAEEVKSTRGAVVARSSQIKYIRAVKKVTLSGCTVSNITLKACYKDDDRIAQATLYLDKQDGRENRIRGCISILPPIQTTTDSDGPIPRVQLSIIGNGHFNGSVQFVACRGTVHASDDIIIG
ncbi:MAG: hypothetical protein K940chlam3_00593 [Chlamydiae bacterium]|nr:hypothetical protein [Chlamydiota bacterium]